MRFYRPRSFFSLLLLGFFFVSLPLFTALFSSVQILDGLLQQSAVAVFRSVSRVENSRKLVDLLHDQERSARLYNVLGESVHLQEVNRAQEKVEQVLAHFIINSSDVELIGLIELLDAKVRHLVAALNKVSGDPESRKQTQETTLLLYSEVGSIAAKLERQSNTLMVNEVDQLRESVRRNKTALSWQVSGLIGFSVLLIIFFISLIVKPVSQIDKGIDRLGEGDFSTPIAVSGSRDLEALGEKLDWLRKRLNKLDREKVKMIAHISHELKTPLASIKEGAGLLKDGLVGTLTVSQEEVVSILDKNCDKLQRLIENILDFNMAEAKEMPIDQTELPLDALIRDVAADHHNPTLARNIALELTLEPAAVLGNLQQIKTVFDNLLANAVKFTPDNGTIRIYMRKKSGSVNVIVEDSGPGISEEDRAQIFLPFFQGNQPKQAAVKGSGLGLAISKEYVQNCGGSLRLLPSRQGARFSVTLPRMKGGME
ncbi:HAMP domain-containing sensor histidine kinase [Desulfogranum mediterraneum]|uniref:HAMP domain-containing sensor histidine kinase n=1 Tax=Desulfogranum mediterraneum TaxID=160661 RepID=UPI0003F538D0|nr:HAMP domain-containing sensor histidine kinase [Desulfogranum mediterraneum]